MTPFRLVQLLAEKSRWTGSMRLYHHKRMFSAWVDWAFHEVIPPGHVTVIIRPKADLDARSGFNHSVSGHCSPKTVISVLIIPPDNTTRNKLYTS